LLRLRPVEAWLSPAYDIAEDDAPLIHETFEAFFHAVEGGTLAEELGGAEAASRADEASATIRDAVAAGLQPESRDTEWYVYYGLDALVEGFIRRRDVPSRDTPPATLDLDAFRTAAEEFVARAGAVAGGSPGADWIIRTARVLRRLRDCDEPV